MLYSEICSWKYPAVFDCLRPTVWLKVCDRGLGMWPNLYSGPVCDDSIAEVAVAILNKLIFLLLQIHTRRGRIFCMPGQNGRG